MTGHLSWLRGRHHRANVVALFSLLLVAVASASAQSGMTPSGPLAIQGTGYSSTLMTFQSAEPTRYGATIRTTYADGWYRLIFDTQSNSNFPNNFVLKSGKVGIGTMDPDETFVVVGNGRIDATTPSGSPYLRFTSRDGQLGNPSEAGKIVAQAETISGWGLGVFTKTQAGALTEKLRINNAGNVGIGTVSPLSKLHVAGDIQVDGNIAAKYQDVAEWVPSPRNLVPGIVVVIDQENSNRVTPADQAYDTKVAGVVSSQPGIVLGEPGPDKSKVAHTGRVRVKVDASYGAVAVGDLLVTSKTPGYAMRSEPVNVGGVSVHRPGTLIGKALEPLKERQGEILVLSMLQ